MIKYEESKMPKYWLKTGDLELDIKRLSATVEKRAYQKMRQAARVFLRAAIERIPVWTGEAMGSLAPIAHELHVRIPATPNPDAPYNGFGIGMTQGKTSEPFITQEGWKFSFEIGSNVDHFNINDRFNVNKWGIMLRNPTPWEAFQHGAIAAKEFLNRTAQDIFPNFADFIIIKNMVTYE
jgi:hypothetical protein